jgi:trigger factor
MNITQNNIDALNAEISIELDINDYATNVENALKKHRKTAQMPGFRAGQVPMSLIKQRFGKSVLAEEINQVLQRSLHQYISEKKLNVLGSPMPLVDGREVANWENPSQFKFYYQLGLAPEVNLDLDKNLKFTHIVADVDEHLVTRQIKDFAKRYGKMSEVDVCGDEDMLTVAIVEVDNQNQTIVGGIASEGSVFVEFIKDTTTKQMLVGLKIGDTVVVNPHHLSENHNDLAKLLGITHEAVHHLESSVQLTVNSIQHMEMAELNQELFDRMYGEGAVSSEEEFRNKVRAGLMEQFDMDAKWMFARNAKRQLTESVTLTLPDAFLRRWIHATNDKPLSPEQMDFEYPHYANQLRWTLIENHLIQSNDIRVTQEEVKVKVKQSIAANFAQYGIPVAEENLEDYAKSAMTKQEDIRKVYEQIFEERLMELINEKCEVELKQVTFDEFVHAAQH